MDGGLLQVAEVEANVPYHTRSEIDQAITALTPHSFSLLTGYARLESLKLCSCGGMSANDLLQEAFEATIAGRRHWYRDRTFVNHLRWSMRSIADNYFQKHPPTILFQSSHDDGHSDGVHTMLESSACVTQLLTWLAKYPDAQNVANSIMDDEPQGDAQSRLGIDDTAYNNARRQIRRVLLTHQRRKVNNNVTNK